MASLCLNMIVRNETAIIERLLESVSTLIDDFVICDTGSTDDTVSKIRAFFAARNIPGEVIDTSPFVNFGQNRTDALSHCRDISKSSHILLLDADMVLRPPADPIAFKRTLDKDAYHLFQGGSHLMYKNMRIVRNMPGFSYWGVTHEYVVVPPGSTHAIIPADIMFIADLGDGGCKTDKFERDIKLLTQGLVDTPNNDRYTFYLANSYRDAGQPETAIKHYLARISLGGWAEECWASHYAIGMCYSRMGENARAITAWLEGYDHSPHRVETLYEIAKYYRIAGKQRLSMAICLLALREITTHSCRDHLFLQKDVYDYKVAYEASIVGYYHNPANLDLVALTMQVLNTPNADSGICKSALSNFKFYAKPVLSTYISATPGINTRLLASLGQNIMQNWVDTESFVASTPSICGGSGSSTELVVCTRFVNYHIDDNGGYINKDHIVSINIISVINITENEADWKVVREFELGYDTSGDGRYVGLEDVRLMRDDDGNIWYTANRGILGKMSVEHGRIDMDMGKTVDSKILQYSSRTDTEKNWVMAPPLHLIEQLNESQSNQAPIRCIYGWSPLLTGDIVGDTFVPNPILTQNQSPPIFKYLRGSTNGIIIENEIWFITHAVSYEARRYYYHCVVALDAITLAPRRWTPFFTLFKEKVEYCLGFHRMGDNMLVSSSVMDRDSRYTLWPIADIDAMMTELPV